MKKFFSFVVAVFATIAVSAQTYDLSTMTFAQSDLTVTEGTINDNTSKEYFEVKTAESDVPFTLTVNQLPNMVFKYKNKDAGKIGVKVYYEGKIQADSKNVDLTINNVTPGTLVTFSVASKGSTGASFTDSGTAVALTDCVFQSGTLTFGAKGTETAAGEFTVMATGTSLTIRETAGGYVLTKVVIGNEDTALQNATVENKKAQKVIENGVVYIIKNGVKYNVLGAVVE